jgi:hypothetical protein
MGYIKIYKKWRPYALMSDKRGFISLRFGNGHTGIDSVGNQANNPICAVIDGTVLETYYSQTNGNVVKYGRGNVKIAHYHLATISVVEGQKVIAGETKLGVEGNTGSYSRGKHLHTSMWIDGVLVNPEDYLSGARQLKIKEDDMIMTRKVIRDDLNMRSGPGANYSSYGMVGVGTIINPYETRQVNGATWGKHTTLLSDGKVYTGWSNIGDTWSTPYKETVYSDNGKAEISRLSEEITKLSKEIELLTKKLEDIKDIVQ